MCAVVKEWYLKMLRRVYQSAVLVPLILVLSACGGGGGGGSSSEPVAVTPTPVTGRGMSGTRTPPQLTILMTDLRVMSWRVPRNL